MPDLVTHAGVGVLLRARAPRSSLVWFAVGSCLPDLASRVPGLGLALASWLTGLPVSLPVLEATGLCHMPLPYLVLCGWVALLLPARTRATAFVNLWVAGWLHLSLDTLQRHLNGGYTLAYPFSMRRMELGWIENDASLTVAPVLGLALLGVLGWRIARGRPTGS